MTQFSSRSPLPASGVARQGESVDPVAITVPVSGRGAQGGSLLGNLVSPLLVDVPTVGTVGERLMRVEADVRAHRAAASGPAPIAILGGLFRLIARLGGYRYYMSHQRRFHTLVTHVRGPIERGHACRVQGERSHPGRCR